MELLVKNGAIPVFKPSKTEEYSVELDVSIHLVFGELMEYWDIFTVPSVYISGSTFQDVCYYDSDIGECVYLIEESTECEDNDSLVDVVSIWVGVDGDGKDIYIQKEMPNPGFKYHFRAEHYPNNQTYWMNQPTRALGIAKMEREMGSPYYTLTVDKTNKHLYRYFHGKLMVEYEVAKLVPIYDEEEHIVDYKYEFAYQKVQNNWYNNEKWINILKYDFPGKPYEETIANVELTKTSTN